MKKYPRHLGNIAARVTDESTVVYNNRGFVVANISSPIIKDNDGSCLFLSLSSCVTTGNIWRRFVGLGGTIAKIYSGVDRTVVQTISLTEQAIIIEHEVTYSDSKAVVVDGEFINVRISGYDCMADKCAISPVTASAILNATDECNYTQNFNFDSEGVQNYTNYQTRVNEEKRTARIQILHNGIPKIEKMLQPSGRLASIIFTNHADLASVESVRTIFFGTSDVANPVYNTKGFAGHGLKTTWSAFYLTEGSHIGLDNEDFATLMDSVYLTGTEVVPHRTRSGDTNTREDAVSHLPFYDTHFNTRNWIDHGLLAGARNLGLKSGGWDSTDNTLYIMDLLQSYGYEYCWAYFDTPEENLSGINHLHLDWVGLPHYLIYQNNNLNLSDGTPMWQWWSWRAGVGKLLEYMTTANIDDLIDHFGVSINHEYFAASSLDGYFYHSGTPYLIDEEFDAMLAYVAAKQTSEELWNPTMSEFGDYFREIAQVDILITGNNSFTVTNNSGGTITGFALRVKRDCSITVGGVEVNKKTSGDYTIFWWDLATGDSAVTLA